MNLREIERLLLRHLEESGQIRTDLAWLKKAFWTLAGLGMTFNSIMAEEVLRHLWK